MNEIVGVLSAILSVISLIWLVYQTRSLKKTVAEYTPLADSIADLLRYEENEEGEPMLDARLVQLTNALGSSLAKSLKMSILGSLSGTARLEKGLKGAMAQDAIDKQMPMLNLVGDFLGFNTKEYITEHPEAMGQLLQMFGPVLGKLKMGSGIMANPGGNGRAGYG